MAFWLCIENYVIFFWGNYPGGNRVLPPLSKWPPDGELIQKWLFLTNIVTLMAIPSNFINFHPIPSNKWHFGKYEDDINLFQIFFGNQFFLLFFEINNYIQCVYIHIAYLKHIYIYIYIQHIEWFSHKGSFILISVRILMKSHRFL